MRRDLLKGVVLGSIVAVVVSTAAVAFAGTGIGAVFNIGQTNAVNAQTVLQSWDKNIKSNLTMHADGRVTDAISAN